MRVGLLAVLLVGCGSVSPLQEDGGVSSALEPSCQRCIVYSRWRCASDSLVEQCVPGACEGTNLGHWETVAACAGGARCVATLQGVVEAMCMTDGGFH